MRVLVLLAFFLVAAIRGESLARPMSKEEAPDTHHWKEFVGEKAEDVVKRIQAENPKLRTVVAIPAGAMVTADHRMDRVRVYHDAKGSVVRPPKLG